MANTFVGKNAGNGILVQPVGSASVTAVFDRVRTQYNSTNANGISLDATQTAGTVSGTATDTVSSDNGTGFDAEGIAATLTVLRSVAADNQIGVSGEGPSPSQKGAVNIGQSALINNAVAACNGTVPTFKDNYVTGNGFNGCNGSPIALE